MTDRSKIVSLLTNLTRAHSPAHKGSLRVIKGLEDFVRFVKLLF